MGQSDVLLIDCDFRGTYYATKPMGARKERSQCKDEILHAIAESEYLFRRTQT